jgi:hypothetical protein
MSSGDSLGCKSEHQTLIASTAGIHTHCDIRRLRIDAGHDGARFYKSKP